MNPSSAPSTLLRVGFNVQNLYDSSLRGWNRYAVNIACEIAALGVEVFAYSNLPIAAVHAERLQNAGVRLRVTSRRKYWVWLVFDLPIQLHRDGVHIYHSPIHYGLPFTRGSQVKAVLTLHDAIGMEHITWRNALSFRNCFSKKIFNLLDQLISRQTADHVITVSHFSAEQLASYLGSHPVTVIYNGADDVSPVSEMTDGFGQAPQNPYFLYYGGWEPRKNVVLLLRAFASARISGGLLVLAGGTETQIQEMTTLARGLSIERQCVFHGWIEESTRRELLAGAAAFIYPSLMEGFGLQLCEAMNNGVPVLAARASCLPEVLADGGETFDPQDPSELAILLRRVMEDAEFRTKLRERSAARSMFFSWKKAARETLAVYRRTLGPISF